MAFSTVPRPDGPVAPGSTVILGGVLGSVTLLLWLLCIFTAGPPLCHCAPRQAYRALAVPVQCLRPEIPSQVGSGVGPPAP